jgi:hypothetical protein
MTQKQIILIDLNILTLKKQKGTVVSVGVNFSGSPSNMVTILNKFWTYGYLIKKSISSFYGAWLPCFLSKAMDSDREHAC